MSSRKQKIIPHLWFDNEAQEAVELYTSLLENSRTYRKSYYGKAGYEIHGQPEGTLMSVDFDLAGQRFVALNGGPIFEFNPSVSFLVACDTVEEVETLWNRLIQGGMAYMDLGTYPFSERYGWLRDRYGLSWQLMHRGAIPYRQKITPTFMFVGSVCGKAEEAIRSYCALFEDSEVGNILRYGAGEEPDREGTIRHASFTLAGQDFAAMDSALDHRFSFNEAVSFMVFCETQEEIDYFWGHLSAVPEAEQCGWLKDHYGLSWQIVPTLMEEILQDKDTGKMERVTEAFLKMKKFDIKALEKAYSGV